MPDTRTHAGSRLIFAPGELDYDFGPGHPMQPSRLVALLDLLESSGLWQRENEQTRLPLRAATIEELSLIHRLDYIAAVQQLSVPQEVGASQGEGTDPAEWALNYGLGEGDTRWDVEGLGITPRRYRELIARLFASQGFVEHDTTEPNISMEPANILLVRVGKRVDQHVANQFFSRILSPSNLSRW